MSTAAEDLVEANVLVGDGGSRARIAEECPRISPAELEVCVIFGFP
jgi:hypothetical protein